MSSPNPQPTCNTRIWNEDQIKFQPCGDPARFVGSHSWTEEDLFFCEEHARKARRRRQKVRRISNGGT